MDKDGIDQMLDDSTTFSAVYQIAEGHRGKVGLSLLNQELADG